MDTDLVTGARGGDQEAFADLVYAVAHPFAAVAHRILSDIDLAEDATQQALRPPRAGHAGRRHDPLR